MLFPSGTDADRSAKHPIGIQYDTALGDLDLAGPGQDARGFPGRLHEIAPPLTADRPRGLRGADASSPDGEQITHRSLEPLDLPGPELKHVLILHP